MNREAVARAGGGSILVFGPAALAAWTLVACGGASPDPGTRALLHVANAQFVPGPLPAPAGGPRVTSAQGSRARIPAGLINESIVASLDLAASSAAIGIPGDQGYWVVPAQPPRYESPNQLSIDVTMSFSPALPAGPFQVEVQAGDRAGRFGPPAAVSYVATHVAPPAGGLVITLSWDTEADLDVHVLTPSGAEIWRRQPSSYQPPLPGFPADPGAMAQAGVLDFDSNAECRIDGRRQEDVVFATPPAGHFVVRVDTFSLCGQPDANWTVEARRAAQVFATARGESTAFDTRPPHENGAGVTALEFDQP